MRWRLLCDSWATFLAEFTLSDVVISDLFFLQRDAAPAAARSKGRGCDLRML